MVENAKNWVNNKKKVSNVKECATLGWLAVGPTFGQPMMATPVSAGLGGSDLFKVARNARTILIRAFLSGLVL